MPLPTLEHFYNMLLKHDWYYPFSDDITAFTNGHRQAKVLADIASLSIDHAALYSAFEDHFFSGPAFGTARIERPKRP